MVESKIERLILDKEFSYLPPYFYDNPYALRCELGIGRDEEYLINAKRRAMELYDVLFPAGADAIIFNYWIYDHSECGEADTEDPDWEECVGHSVEQEAKQLRFLLECQRKYRHFTVRDLATYDDPDDREGTPRRNRVICYRDDQEFDHSALIDGELGPHGREVGFVSFENECILSVYDDRGCDIVFATREKMNAFYHKLRPYFLNYDLDEMENRHKG